jgi:hypothetical protein
MSENKKEVHGRPFETPEQQIIARLDFVEEQLDDVLAFLKQIIAQLAAPKPVPTGVSILQISKGGTTLITGIQAGGTPSVFESDPIPSSIAFPAGTVDTWTSSDPLVTVTPSTTNPAQVTASTPATNTNTTFNLTVSTQMPAVNGVTPAPLTATVAVPIIAAPAPVPTGVTINQIS